MLTALLLCFEDENFCLQRSAAGTFCVQKAQEFAQYLQRYFDIRSSLFDETFYRGIASIFYRLQNQRQFSVINDREATSGVSRLGLPAFLKKISGLRWNRTMRWKASTS